jgi:hypothetical protein
LASFHSFDARLLANEEVWVMGNCMLLDRKSRARRLAAAGGLGSHMAYSVMESSDEQVWVGMFGENGDEPNKIKKGCGPFFCFPFKLVIV